MIINIKSRKEIEGFKEAGKIAASILETILDKVEVGQTTKNLNDLAISECKNHNVTPVFLGYNGFPASICTSVNKELVHGIPNGRPLEEGDILSVDIGIEKDGFIGDTAETIIVTSKDKNSSFYPGTNLIDKCRESLYSGIEQARAGNKLFDIAKAITKVSKKAKFSIPLGYGGHGIDRYKLHADPFVPNKIQNEYNLRLWPGMIIAIEPMFIDGKGKTEVLNDNWTVVADGVSAHCEHTILITKEDPIVLTKR